MTEPSTKRRDSNDRAARAPWTAPVLRQANIRDTAIGGLERGEIDVPGQSFDS